MLWKLQVYGGCIKCVVRRIVCVFESCALAVQVTDVHVSNLSRWVAGVKFAVLTQLSAHSPRRTACG
jgi:hypothetical protein